MLFVEDGRQVEETLPRPFAKLNYYRDVIVVAYPSLAGKSRSLRSLVLLRAAVLRRQSSASGSIGDT
jgi:hypothetical protein